MYIAEAKKEIPFEIKRVYFIDELNGTALRGRHAHKKLEQIVFCLRGSCEIEQDDGEDLKTFKINSTEKERGFYMAPGLWYSLSQFSPDCLLVVFASQPYDESDYIRNFEDFQKSR